MRYTPKSGSFEVRASSKRVACGKGRRRRGSVVFVPHRVKRVAATGARIEIVKRGSGRDVFVYPNGGTYRVFSGTGPRVACGT